MKQTKEKTFYDIFWIFFLSSIFGALIEMVFCRIVQGYWMSRSSLLYGPFSIVWGLGAALLTLTLKKVETKGSLTIFFTGFVWGGVYEYVCSIFIEYIFGVKFWDYSHVPFNLQGRTSLSFCLAWGIVSIVWIKFVYPLLNRFIQEILKKIGKAITWTILIFMVFNMILSATAIMRTAQRQKGVAAKTSYELFLDQYYPDERIQKRYQNMRLQ